MVQRRRERWDGRDQWRPFRFTSASRAVSAVVDPDEVLRLDVDRTNNSRALEPRGPQRCDEMGAGLAGVAAGSAADLQRRVLTVR